MSNALHHVAPASFFPTAKELSSGLQWFKEHPLLAAAAATAVSVITYMHTAEDDTSAAEIAVDGTTSDADTAAKDGAIDSIEPQRSSPTRRASAPLTGSRVAQSPPLRRTSLPGRVTPPALRKPGSEGKLASPAAVSWVDEHGGSLTQVFEHLEINDLFDDSGDDQGEAQQQDTGYPDLDRPLRSPTAPSPPRCHGRPPTPRRSARPAPEDHAQKEDSPSGVHWMGALAHGGVQSPQPPGASQPSHDRQTASPQWGWYVAITPPRDHLAEAQPTTSSNGESSMRRSTSGRIQS